MDAATQLQHFQEVTDKISTHNATLVAVSKTKPKSQITELYEVGQLDFGENRVQELIDKHESLPKDIRWHFIGHLQTNKVKYIASFVHLVHSIDSFKILKEINKQAAKADRVIKCLLQFKIAEEDTKYGLDIKSARTMLEHPDYINLKYIEIIGVMGMATFTEDKKQVKEEFTRLRNLFELIKKDYFSQQESFKEISMGMSGDYELALSEGSTMVRIGSLIFGSR